MKVIHIESGLGNQMLSFCEYLAIKSVNPGDDCLIETIVYDIPECNEVICQWNGYELDTIFHLHAPNVKSMFSDKQWEALISHIRQSRFWERNWNYPVHFTQAFEKVGIKLRNVRGDFEAPGAPYMTPLSKPGYKKTFIFQYLNYIRKKYIKHPSPPPSPELFIQSEDNVFTGQQLTFKNKGAGIERIDKEVRECFTFPALCSKADLSLAEEVQSCQSVAIHARRGDMLSYNFDCYYGGYFKRAVKYLKQSIPNPHFYIFCDPGSVEWAKHNSKVFGLDFRKDHITFVDWNKGETSWRDMQLISLCKHQVITRSSFGWWGAYLNSYKDKITCSPDDITNTTHHF